MSDYDYFFDIRTSTNDSNKVDIRLCRCKIVRFMGFFSTRIEETQILNTVYGVERKKDHIKLVVDDMESKKSIYEKEMNDKMATEQFIQSVNGKSIKK